VLATSQHVLMAFGVVTWVRTRRKTNVPACTAASRDKVLVLLDTPETVGPGMASLRMKLLLAYSFPGRPVFGTVHPGPLAFEETRFLGARRITGILNDNDNVFFSFSAERREDVVFSNHVLDVRQSRCQPL